MKTSRITSAVLAVVTAVSLCGCNIVVEDQSSSASQGGASQGGSSSGASQGGTSANSSSADSGSTAESSAPAAESSEITPPDDPTPPVDPPATPDADGEMSGTVFVLNTGRGIVLYGGGKSVGKDYGEWLSKYKAKLGDDVNVYSLVSPTAGSYYLPEKYKDYMASEKDNINNINDNLVGVTPIDAYSVFAQHTDEHIFFSTDHHWAPLGAYYAAQEFAKVAGVPFADMSKYNAVSRDGYVGTLYGYSDEDKRIRDNPENFTYYEPTNTYTTTFYGNTDVNLTAGTVGNLLKNIDNLATVSWYLVFIGTDDIITHITTDCANGRKLMIVKDSYGNAMAPCLTSSFEDIFVVDMRYFQGSVTEFAKAQGVTDLLFVMNTFSATGGNEKHLSRIY